MLRKSGRRAATQAANLDRVLRWEIATAARNDSMFSAVANHHYVIVLCPTQTRYLLEVR